MGSRGWAAVVWTAVAVSAALWGAVLRTPSPPERSARPRLEVASPVDWQRIDGVAAADPEPIAPPPTLPGPAAGHLKLHGTIAPAGDRQGGIALISSGPIAARAFPMGATVEGELVLQSIEARRVRLVSRDGVMTVTLELPQRTGALAPPPAPLRPREAVDDPILDASPIVPPTPDLKPPRASESGTVGSDYRRRRDAAAGRAASGPDEG